MSPASIVPRSWQKRSRRASRTGGEGGRRALGSGNVFWCQRTEIEKKQFNRSTLDKKIYIHNLYSTTSNHHRHFFGNFVVLCLVWNGQLSNYTMFHQARSWNNDSATSRRRMLNPPWETRRCHPSFSALKKHDINDVTGKWWRSRKKLYFSDQNANHGHVSLMANLNGQALFSDLPWLHDNQNSDCLVLVGISRINDVGLPRAILWSRISRALFGTKNKSVVPSHGLLWDKSQVFLKLRSI